MPSLVAPLVLCLVERTGKKKMTCLWADEEVRRRGKGFIVPFFLSGISNFGVSAVSSV